MISILSNKGKKINRGFALAVVLLFFGNSLVLPLHAQTVSPVPELPVPGNRVAVSPVFAPAVLRGIRIHPDNPFQFDFIVDVGHSDLQGEDLKAVSTRLIKYFLAALTVPEKNLWVNLSPYEKNRIIPEGFDVTEMGRDLLAQDYFLKQITSSLMYPEDELGKTFWQKVYAKAQEKYGNTKVPVNTFNKVWIVPEQALVHQNENTAFVINSHLKILLEQDYLAAKNNVGSDAPSASDLSSAMVKEVIIPVLEKEVNEGKNFALLRQIYHSVILATWFKRTLKESLLGKAYVGQNKITGVNFDDQKVKDKIYQEYLKAFKKGVYNYIREEYDPATRQMIPRKYFSGGSTFEQNPVDVRTVSADALAQSGRNAARGPLVNNATDLTTVEPDADQRDRNAGKGEFIGKYVTTSPVIFDRERMEIRFMARHVDRPDEPPQEIVLKVQQRMTKKAVLDLIIKGVMEPVMGELVEWFERASVEALVIADNPYGIHGLSWQQDGMDLVALEEQFSDEFLAFLHEIGHSALQRGVISLDDILKELDAQHDEWFQEKAKRYQTEDMQGHYALRALFHQQFPESDEAFTVRIKGRLLNKEIMALLAKHFLDLPFAPIMRDFLRQRQSVNTRAEEEALLMQIGQHYRELRQQQTRQVEGLKVEAPRWDEVDEILQRAFRSFTKHKDQIGRDIAMTAILSRLRAKRFSNLDIAVAVTNFLRQRFTENPRIRRDQLDFEYTVVNYLIKRRHEVIAELLGQLYGYLTQGDVAVVPRIEIENLIKHVGLRAVELTDMDIAVIKGPLSKDLVSRPPIARSQLPAGIAVEQFFESDPGSPDVFYFRHDFLEQMALLPENVGKRRLRTLHVAAHWRRDKAKGIFGDFVHRNRQGELLRSVYELLDDGELAAETRIEVFEMIVANWKNNMRGEYFNALVVTAIKAYQEMTLTDYSRHRMLAAFRNLSVYQGPVETYRSLAAFLSAELAQLNERKRQMAAELEPLEAELRKVQAQRWRPRKAVQQLRYDLYQKQKLQITLMEDVELRLGALTEIANTLNQGRAEGAQELSAQIVADLKDLYEQPSTDEDIRREILADFSNLIPGGHAVAIAFLTDLALESKTLANSAQLPRMLAESATANEVKAFLRQQLPQERAGFLVLLLHSDDRSLLSQVIFDEAMPAAYRLYAANRYATQFLRDERGIVDDVTYARMIRVLTPLARTFIQQRAQEESSLDELLQEPLMRDHLAQADVMAVLLMLNSFTGNASAEVFIDRAVAILGTKVDNYHNNANAELRIGGKLFDRDFSSPTTFYFQVLAHEVMHGILTRLGLINDMLRNQALHEFFADEAAHWLVEELELSDQFVSALDYEERYAEVKRAEDHSSGEGHQAARALRTVLNKKTKSLDRLRWIRVALGVIGRLQPDWPLRDVMAKIDVAYQRSSPQPGRPAESGEVVVAALFSEGSFARRFFAPDPDPDRVSILTAREIADIRRGRIKAADRTPAPAASSGAVAQSSNVGGIDLDPNDLILQTQGEEINFEMPLDPRHFEKIQIEGLTPVIFKVTPITNLPLFLSQTLSVESSSS